MTTTARKAASPFGARKAETLNVITLKGSMLEENAETLTELFNKESDNLLAS